MREMTVVGRTRRQVGSENLHQRNRASDFAETGRVPVGIETGRLRAFALFSDLSSLASEAPRLRVKNLVSGAAGR